MPNLQKLSIAEINHLNKSGYSLDNSGKKFYALSFLINDKQNNAGDPRPFKIKSSFLPKLVPTALNRAWLPDTLPNGKHIRPNPNATAEEILQFQRDYAGGEMVGYHINPLTNNASVIIDVFPEYQNLVEQGKIKPFVSPMIGNWGEDENGEVYKGEILHLQSVGTPGYDPKYAKFQGTCKGNSLNQCMKELIPLAAAGKLKQYRNSSLTCPKQFFSTLAAQGTSMSVNPESLNDTTPEAAATPADVAMVVGELKKDVEQVKTEASEMENKIMQEVGQVNQKVESLSSDIAEIKTKVMGEKPKENDKETESSSTETTPNEKPAGAAGGSQTVLEVQKELKNTQKELSTIIKERELEKKLALETERKRQVAVIVKKQLLEKQITIEDKEKITKEWLEKKSSSNPEVLADLSLLAEDAEKRIFAIVPEEEKEAMGASGLFADDYPLGEYTNNYDYSAIESSITEEAI